MSTFNPFIRWLVALKPDQAADIRRWFGYLPFDTSHDFEIGMELNGLQLDRVFGELIPKSELPRPLPQKLRPGFIPKPNALAMVIAEIQQPPLSFDIPNSLARTRQVAQNLEDLRRMTLPDDILISANGSTYRCKPGERLRGRVVDFNEVELDVEELTKLVLDNQQDFPEAMAALRSGTNDMRQINLPPLTPPPERPYEDILAAVKKIEAWRAEDQKKWLTDSQVMQLCIHFKLYSLQAIQEFIQEYQR